MCRKQNHSQFSKASINLDQKSEQYLPKCLLSKRPKKIFLKSLENEGVPSFLEKRIGSRSSENEAFKVYRKNLKANSKKLTEKPLGK